LGRYKSPGSDQILAELIQARGETSLFEIHKLINSVWNKEEMPDQLQLSLSPYTDVSFEVMDRLLIRYSAIIRYWREYGSTIK
jgi:hypothetical protein